MPRKSCAELRRNVIINYGKLVRTLNGNFVNGWGNFMESEELYTSDEKAVHRVEVHKNPDSTGDRFTIIGWLVS